MCIFFQKNVYNLLFFPPRKRLKGLFLFARWEENNIVIFLSKSDSTGGKNKIPQSFPHPQTSEPLNVRTTKRQSHQTSEPPYRQTSEPPYHPNIRKLQRSLSGGRHFPQTSARVRAPWDTKAAKRQSAFPQIRCHTVVVFFFQGIFVGAPSEKYSAGGKKNVSFQE